MSAARYPRSIPLLVFATLFFLFSFALDAGAVEHYVFERIYYPGSLTTRAMGVSKAGVVVGEYQDPGYGWRGFFYDGTSYTPFDFPGSTETRIDSVNDSGHFVGQYRDPSGKRYGFLYDGASYVTLDVTGADATRASGLNNSGQVVGYYTVGGLEHGFLYQGGAYTLLDVPGSTQTTPFDIDDSGLVIGRYVDTSGHGFTYNAGVYSYPFDVPGATVTSFRGIDSSGNIVGSYVEAGMEHGFFYDGSAYKRVDPPTSVYTRARKINDHGLIAGLYRDDTYRNYGFLARPYQFFNIDPQGALEAESKDVNSHGIVVGRYRDSNGVLRGFIYDGSGHTTIDYQPNSTYTDLHTINDSGLMGGHWKDQALVLHGFIYDGATFTPYDPPNSTLTRVYNINNSGWWVGGYFDSGMPERGYVYKNGTLDFYHFPNSFDTDVHGINDDGTILVGRYHDQGWQAHGYAYNAGSYFNIDYPGSIGGEAHDVTNSGVIIAGYFDTSGTEHGYYHKYGTDSFTIFDYPGAATTEGHGMNEDGMIVGRYGDSGGVFHAYYALPKPVSSNNPPTADAGENIAVSSEAAYSTVIQGSGSDPDPDSLQCRWLDGTTVLLGWAPVGAGGSCPLSVGTLYYGVGTYTLTIEVTDGKATASDDMILSIENSPPNPAPTGAGVYELGTPITLGGAASDFDGDLLTYTWTEGGATLFSGYLQAASGGTPVTLPEHVATSLGLGIHTLTLTVNDGVNSPRSANITVEVVDTTAPTMSPVPDKPILWPPNHSMVTVTITTNAADSSGLPVTITAFVTSNEPQEGLGDGDLSPDWTVPVIDPQTGVITLNLRGERSGKGSGRVYTIVITVTDSAGNQSTSTVEIRVPHDKGK